MENKQKIVDIPYYKNKFFIKKCNEYAKKEIEIIEKREIDKELFIKINQEMTKSNTFHS